MSNELCKKFSEFVAEGFNQSSGSYPFYAILEVPVDMDDHRRASFIDELAAGLEGVDYKFFADVGGRLRYGFKSEEDRALLYRARNSEDVGNRVLTAMPFTTLRR